jgi:copper chaperone
MLRLSVSGMTCQHCVDAITRGVGALPGVEGVAVDLDHGEVAVQGTPDEAAVRAVLDEEGYDVLARL